MRCYQHVGLTKEAHEFLANNVEMIPDLICSDCGKVITTKQNIVATQVADMFYDDGPTLNAYRLNDGRTAVEVVQMAPWSSGPMGFLCLSIDNERVFEWKYDKECNECDYVKGTHSFG